MVRVPSLTSGTLSGGRAFSFLLSFLFPFPFPFLFPYPFTFSFLSYLFLLSPSLLALSSLFFLSPPALLPGPCWAEKSQKLFSVNLLISSFPPSLAQNLLLLVFLWGMHVHFSMRSDNLDPPGMTNSHLQEHYKIHQLRSVRESGKAWLAGAALPVLHKKLRALGELGMAGMRLSKSGKSRSWREQRRVLQTARDGLILPCSWPDMALVTARVNQWCRLKLKEFEMSPGVWEPGDGDFSGVEFESRKRPAQRWQQIFWKLPSKFHLYTIGVVVIPNDCGVSVGQEFCSVFYTSVS